MIFINYRKCSTCIKAKKHLQSLGIDFIDQDITQGIAKEDLKRYVKMSGYDVRKFFNTSGRIYKENNYKEKLKTMSEDEMITALAENGMLIKRPLLVGDDFVLVGYRADSYERLGERHE